MNKHRPLQEHIDEVMDYLNFDRIQSTMEHLNWEWTNIGIPKVPTLRCEVRNLMKEAYENSYISTGGFTVEYDSDEDSFDVCFKVDYITT